MRIILTGGIGSGKSTIVEMLKKHDIVVIDSDTISKNVFTRNIPAIQDIFATELKGVDLREYVSGIIFSQPKMRMQLATLMHPKIRNIIHQRELELKQIPHVIDMPLYFETKQFVDDDYIILVKISYEKQLERLMSRSGYTKEESDKRILTQLPTSIKERKSDYIIDNEGTLEELEEKALKMITKVFTK